jgi:hypothetical protein
MEARFGSWIQWWGLDLPGRIGLSAQGSAPVDSAGAAEAKGFGRASQQLLPSAILRRVQLSETCAHGSWLTLAAVLLAGALTLALALLVLLGLLPLHILVGDALVAVLRASTGRGVLLGR